MWAWLFSTKAGRSVLLAGVVAATATACWFGFKTHFINEGYSKCKSEWNASIAKANEKTVKEQNKRDEVSSDVSQDTRAKNQEDTKAVDRQADKTKETVNDVYDKPPRTQPVAYGSCVHPVDQRVQDEFERSYREANAPAR